jgi:hypothetical protein
MTSHVDNHSRFLKALRTQAKTADTPPSALPCPYCMNQGRIFQNLDQLLHHSKVEHASTLQAMDPGRVRALVRDEALKL